MTVKHILGACLGRVNARWTRNKIEQPFLPYTNVSGTFVARTMMLVLALHWKSQEVEMKIKEYQK